MVDPIVNPETPPGTPKTPPPVVPPAGPAGTDPLDPRSRALQQDFIAAATKREAELAAVRQQSQAAAAELTATKERLAALEQKEKERAQAEMTEIQRAQAQTADSEAARKLAEDRATALQGQLAAREAEFVRHQEVTRNERIVLGILAAGGVSPNEYEQEGLFLRAGQLTYQGEDERQAKITGLVAGFIAQARPPVAAITPGQTPVIPQSPGPVQIPLPTAPVPPGGSPPSAQTIMEDNYSAHELIEIMRREPQRYAQIEAARQARAKSLGAPLIRVVGSQ